MPKLERGFEFLRKAKGKAGERFRNLVSIHADSFEELVQLAERERTDLIQVKSGVYTIYQSVGEIGWGEFPIASSKIPDAHLPKTKIEARGMGRRITLNREYPELDRESTQDQLMSARFRCAKTEQYWQKMLAQKLPGVTVEAKSALENKEEYELNLRMAQELGLDPYDIILPS